MSMSIMNANPGSPGFDPKVDSVTNPMAMTPPPGKPTLLNNPTPDPMTPERHKRAIRRVRNGIPEPKRKKKEDLPMTDTMKKADKDAAAHNKAAETASSMFALSRQLYTDGSREEAFDLFNRAMDALEGATTAETASAEAYVRLNVRTLLASAFDQNTGAIVSEPTEDEKALAAALEGKDNEEKPATSPEPSTASSVLASIDASLSKPAVNPLASVVASL